MFYLRSLATIHETGLNAMPASAMQRAHQWFYVTCDEWFYQSKKIMSLWVKILNFI